MQCGEEARESLFSDCLLAGAGGAAPTCTSCRLSKLSLLLEAAGTETSASEVKTPRRRQPPVGPGAAAGKHVALEAEKVSKLIVGWDNCDNCVGDPGKVCWDFWDEARQLSLWQHCLVARHKHGRRSG